jgi:hypothetical protein
LVHVQSRASGLLTSALRVLIMAVDRRALRRFPGRKRVGRHRRRTPLEIPLPSVAERLGFAVSFRQVVDADTMRKNFEYDQETLLRTFVADRRARIRAVQAIFYDHARRAF